MRGSWLPVITRVLRSSLRGRSRRTFTWEPASYPSLSWGTSKMPSALRKEDTTPAPRLRWVATSLPPTKPRRTRTNSRYFRVDTMARVRVAVA